MSFFLHNGITFNLSSKQVRFNFFYIQIKWITTSAEIGIDKTFWFTGILYVFNIRIGKRDRIWEVEVVKIFIGENCSNDTTAAFGARDDPMWDGTYNLVLLPADGPKYAFLGGCICTFKASWDLAKRVASNVEKSVSHIQLRMVRKIFFFDR